MLWGIHPIQISASLPTAPQTPVSFLCATALAFVAIKYLSASAGSSPPMPLVSVNLEHIFRSVRIML